MSGKNKALIVLGIFAALIVVGIAATPAKYLFRYSKTVSGIVIDCADDKPIAGANIQVLKRGWGQSDGGVVWDKNYITTAQSDATGLFNIQYTVGMYADISVSQEGYYMAKQYELPTDNAVIRLRSKADPAVGYPYQYGEPRTHSCVFDYECQRRYQGNTDSRGCNQYSVSPQYKIKK